MTSNQKNSTEWLNAFLPLGCAQNDSWEPRGGGVLLIDPPLVWLITAREVVESLGAEHLTAWVPSNKGAGLFDVTHGQQQTGVDWVHHPVGISATLFPIDPSFTIKAFADNQCTKVRDLQQLQPTATVGCLYGPDVAPTPYPKPAVCDGIISSIDHKSGHIYSTAPLLPRNLGSPLLLASPYGGAVTLAGILLGNVMLTENDPRVMPVRLSHAVCIDAALELIRGKDASAQRRRITEQTKNPPADPKAVEPPPEASTETPPRSEGS